MQCKKRTIFENLPCSSLLYPCCFLNKKYDSNLSAISIAIPLSGPFLTSNQNIPKLWLQQGQQGKFTKIGEVKKYKKRGNDKFTWEKCRICPAVPAVTLILECFDSPKIGWVRTYLKMGSFIPKSVRLVCPGSLYKNGLVSLKQGSARTYSKWVRSPEIGSFLQ